MKILLVNDLSIEGGAEVQHWREYELLRSNGHEVYSLTFDGNYPASKGPKYNIPIIEGDVRKLLTRALPLGPKGRIDEILKDLRPELVHVNNVIKTPLAIYQAVAPYASVQTIRDYSAVCPKATCVKSDFSICEGEKFGDCAHCDMSRNSRIKSHLRPRIEKARRSAIDVFISPSQALADACTHNGMPTICVNNPFDFSKLPERSFDFARKTFLYYGIISENKGVGRLLAAFDEFSQMHPDTTLMLAGKVTPEFESTLDAALSNNANVSYLGVLSNTEMLKVLSTAYCVIVPSLWIENYPNTVLEPLSAGVLVIGSNRGGIPELIQNEGLLFDVTSKTSIVKAMEHAYSLPYKDYLTITEEGSRRVRKNNSLERFYERLTDVFDLALKKHALRNELK
jgi:glycosyltransferase involved in cell wall biosynthesis